MSIPISTVANAEICYKKANGGEFTRSINHYLKPSEKEKDVKVICAPENFQHKLFKIS
jgi:hypothetical protein